MLKILKMNKISIIICDDHALILDGLQKYFNEIDDIEVIAVSTTLSELQTALQQYKVDVLLLDIQLPDGNSTELLPSIKSKYPEMAIVALSYLKDRTTILSMIQKGTSGYLIKTSSISEIELAVREVSAGGVYYCQEAQVALYDQQKNLQTVMSLSKREKEILQLIVKGMTAAEISKTINISPQTVDTHRKNMMRKLEVHKIASLIEKAKELAII